MLLNTPASLKKMSYFDNPNMYFTTNTWDMVTINGYGYAKYRVYKWDMNCKTQGYDSCKAFDGISKCANDS